MPTPSVKPSFEELYFGGDVLYGDDFEGASLASWYQQEEYGYIGLMQSNAAYGYSCHALNRFHAFRFLSGRRYNRCLVVGSARGDDVAPIAGLVDAFVALEPAEEWWTDRIGGTPAEYVKPAISGDIPLPAGSVDLVVCLSVLHHIANVSHVLTELKRVLCPGGRLILREPICTMGDWRKPRRGLTPTERGLPPKWLDRVLASLEFRILRKRFCCFPATERLARVLRLKPAYNSAAMVRLDWIFSSLLQWNCTYHRETLYKKVAPAAVFYILEK